MGEPSATNTTASGINSIIASTGGTIVKVVEGAIIADTPFLGFPLIKPIWEYLFNWIASYYIQAAEQGATFTAIDIQVGSEESSLSQALKNLIAAEKTNDPVQIQAAIQAYANAQSSLVASDGSA